LLLWCGVVWCGVGVVWWFAFSIPCAVAAAVAAVVGSLILAMSSKPPRQQHPILIAGLVYRSDRTANLHHGPVNCTTNA